MADTYGVGARVRAARKIKGLTLEVAAGLAGMSAAALSRYETGVRPLEQLRVIDALAEALGVSRAWLLGASDDSMSAEQMVMLGCAEDIRRALIDTELGAHPGVTPRPVAELEVAAHRAQILHFEGNGAAAARLAPDVITELHAWVVDGDETERATALQALTVACGAASMAAKWAGQFDLTWIAAGRGGQAARILGDPTWIGLSDFYTAHALAPYSRSYAHSARAIEALQPHAGADDLATQVYGMLHLMAGFAAGVLGESDNVRGHLAEATQFAERVGDRTDLGMYFGPTNVGIWATSIAVEQGQGGRAAELARSVDVAAMPSRLRRANLYADLGRGFAQERRDRQALVALRQADEIAPEMVRTHPMVREAVTGVIGRAERAAIPAELRQFAAKVGALPR